LQVKLYVFPDLKHFIYNTVTQIGGGVKICILRHLFSLNCWSENCFSWPRNWRLWLKWSSFRCLIERDSPQCYQKGASDWPLFFWVLSWNEISENVSSWLWVGVPAE